MKQELVIRDWLPEQLANSNLNWRVRRKRHDAAKVMAWACAKYAKWEPVTTRARLTVTFVFPQRRRRDTDNLYNRAKGCVDGLKDWFVDDSTDWLDLRVTAVVEPGVRETRLVLESA